MDINYENLCQIIGNLYVENERLRAEIGKLNIELQQTKNELDSQSAKS